jgi:hypothetical protein
MQVGQSTWRKLTTLLGGPAAALLEIAFIVAVQATALLSVIAVIVALIIADLLMFWHAFSLSLEGRVEQILLVTVNAGVIVVLIWSFRQRKLRQAEQFHVNNQRQQHQRAAKPSEEDEWWTILEVSPDASANEIRRSYLRKIQQYHPDRVGRLALEVRELAESRSKMLNAAYTEGMRDRRGTP